MESNELKIELYPEKEPRYSIEKSDTKILFDEEVLSHSFDDSNKKFAFLNHNVPILDGFYTAHANHYPIRIKPDDIWLLIVQAFSHHVNANAEELRHLFVNFDGKQTLKVEYPLYDISQVDRKTLEDFSQQINSQMTEFLGEKLLNTLNPDFTTTTYDTSIICKVSIMGAFKKYFNYEMHLCGCGVPYLILEGTAEDYRKIIIKAKELSQYQFDWYINRIIPHIQKMVEAKEGHIDVDYFKNMVQQKKVTETTTLSGIKSFQQVEFISGWILNFFAYYNRNGKLERFTKTSMKVDRFNSLASQMLTVPFKIVDEAHNLVHFMKYKVGFIGCDQNSQNEVFPVQGWWAYEGKD